MDAMKGVRAMNWKTFFLKFFRNLVISVVSCVAVLGLLGYLLGGTVGLINMAYWGLTLGLLGGFSWGIGMIFEAKFWGGEDNYKLFPLWNWFIKNSDDDHTPDY
jgi:drug/metabolite transporter (DMT)-like permease